MAPSAARRSSYVVRQLRPADVPAAQRLFAAGMLETVAPGLLRELARPAGKPALVGFGVIGLSLAARPTLAVGVGSSLAVAALAFTVSQFFSRKYVRDCLRTDMNDPMRHYVVPRRNNFLVAVDAVDGAVVGTVAVEAVEATPRVAGRKPPPHSWEPGDAELRRMSVDPRARGCGVADALCDAVLEHARAHGFRRVVLSTSSMQVSVLIYEIGPTRQQLTHHRALGHAAASG